MQNLIFAQTLTLSGFLFWRKFSRGKFALFSANIHMSRLCVCAGRARAHCAEYSPSSRYLYLFTFRGLAGWAMRARARLLAGNELFLIYCGLGR